MNESKAPPEFSQQEGAAARTDRSHAQREIQRHLLRIVPRALRLDAARREFVRRLTGRPHVIEFYHQVDDAYSHLALETIETLLRRYAVEFRFYLTTQTDLAHAPEPELLTAYARRDCASVAPHYGLEFPGDSMAPSREAVSKVERMLAGLTLDPRFLEIAVKTGRALWQGDDEALDHAVRKIPAATDDEVSATLAAGNERRTRQRHYSGGMFFYAGEWYWGVDRLHHLERRLIRLGAALGAATTPKFDRPAIDAGSVQNDGRLHLEMFPSLRSPYTAMIFERSMQLAASVGVPVTLHPVMPMVMRGVPAPAAKGLYIMLDALREAKHLGAPFGNMYDPIGRPVELGFSLWPYANEKGRGAEFIAAFLKAAFVDGRSTGSDEGLRHVVEEAGLSFDEARPTMDNETWRAELEANRLTMYDELGLWGVPSYRLTGGDNEPDLCVWGQDRLWLVAAEIRRRLGSA
jgi:2-hydroxychromene-2-carboxylate isomerase